MMRSGTLVMRFGVLSSVVLLSGTGAGEARVKVAISKQVSKAVVLITASGCAGDSPLRNGTGFAFGSANEIVTAYHVVAGCSNLELWYERLSGQPRKIARVSHVLARNDLALLDVDTPPSQASLIAADMVNNDEDFKAIGYAVGQPTLGDLDLTISVGSSRLRDMLPTENQQEIAKTAIDIDQPVLRFSKPMYPGMSGGPIFDERGQLIAVVAGGLKSGAVAASWGWPAALIKELKSSQENPDTTTAPTDTTYAYAVPHNVETVQCGKLTFTRGPTLSFGEIAASSDNLDRLNMTVNFSGKPRYEVEQFQFDVWAHRSSGATVVVPAGLQLQGSSMSCSARSPDGVFEEIIQAAPANDQNEIQLAALNFEASIMAPRAQGNIGWYADNVLTLTGPQYRQDGLVINRKGTFAAMNWIGPNRVRAVHQFETLMARGGSFVGIAAINNNVEQCVAPPNPPLLCNGTPEFLSDWAKFVLATQMSTYPIY